MIVLVTLLCAQTPIGVATQVEADGFAVSERGRVHVGGNVDLRYDTNPVYVPVNPTGDLALRVRGLAGFSQPGERLELSAGIQADYTQYMGVRDPASRRLSAFQAAANVALLANKNGWMTFFFTEQLSRVEQPANDAIAQRLRSLRSYARTGTDIRPGGRALEIRAQYGFDFIYFDDNQTSVLEPRALTHMTHQPALRGLWRFFPKTALTLDAEGAFTRYPFPSATFTNPAINALRAQAGIIGLITPKLTVTARAGYANTFTQPSSLGSFSSVIGHAQIAWQPLETTTVTVGYTRDFAPTSVYGWVSFDKPFVELQQLFFQRFAFHLRALYEYQRFGTPTIVGLTQRQDHVFRGEARLSAHIIAWLAASLFYLPDIRLTPFISPLGVSGAYVRHVVGFDITASY